MKFISLAGEPPVYLVIVLFLVWFYDYKTGARIALIVSFSAAIQSLAKLIFRQPRPYLVSDKIVERVPERGFGFPSGHSSVGAAFYASVMHRWKSILVWMTGITLIFLMGISRVCLGAHSFFQVAAGWILGIAVVIGYFCLEKKIGKTFLSYSRTKQIFFILAMMLIVFSLTFIAGKTTLEEFLWEGELGLPLGLFLGFSIGTILFLHRKISISTQATRKKNVMKFIVLVSSVAVFMLILGVMENITDKTVASFSVFSLSILFGLWGMYLGPIFLMGSEK